MARPPGICMEPAEQGPCRGLYQRWTFAAAKGMCVPFNYGGCRGTSNNFLTQEDCLSTCNVILGAVQGKYTLKPLSLRECDADLLVKDFKCLYL